MAALQRGRFYVFDAHKCVMARITPLAGPTFLLEAPWCEGWSKARSGSWRVVLGALERDKLGTFHGLGALASKGKGGSSAQQKLRALGVPVPVLAEPRKGIDGADKFQPFIDAGRPSRLGLHQDVMRTKKDAKFRELLSGKLTEAFPTIEEYGKGEILLEP